MRDYRSFKLWPICYNFVLDLYPLINDLPEFEHRNICSQLRRSATSILLNIAEGSAKLSDRYFLNHMNYAFASAKEVEVLLEMSKDLAYISEDVFVQFYERLEKVKAMLYRFLKDIEKRCGSKKQRVLGDLGLKNIHVSYGKPAKSVLSCEEKEAIEPSSRSLNNP